MAILAIIAVIALGGYACGFIKARELSALRKEMKLYVDRIEAAELDLHAIRSVAEHRLHGAGKQFADLYSRIDGATVTLTPEDRHCCKVSDEAAFCLIQRPYISKTLFTRRISPRGSP
ncbi:hypothetical protein [Klebsiella variicola]|uniref:hypothetical protein n=1 Tax=Klebsiella variicola TaxID=244366 RepID=UPI002F352C34